MAACEFEGRARFSSGDRCRPMFEAGVLAFDVCKEQRYASHPTVPPTGCSPARRAG
ncbi:hypothetical protein IE4771_CH02596 [Rhizobium etli bv. mimosae str. IE4771]|uniref:Uncharacterized protein n=1 Tax=Rhizobium etli bv. mimosae str. IE4771 TaxID=1432050 RepID=A0A060I801_RHIET|nr:hypothetical protein IE4771_CH02596 [Rhizobium sp. IE4771]